MEGVQRKELIDFSTRERGTNQSILDAACNRTAERSGWRSISTSGIPTS